MNSALRTIEKFVKIPFYYCKSLGYNLLYYISNIIRSRIIARTRTHRRMKGRRFLSLILVAALIVLLTSVAAVSSTTAWAESSDNVEYVEGIAFSLTATTGDNIVAEEGVKQTSPIKFTLDAGDKGNGNVKFFYYCSYDSATLDITALDASKWTSIAKASSGDVTATYVVDGTYNQTAYYYFKSEASYSVGSSGATATYTYTYYYSEGSDYVFGLKENINDAVKHYYVAPSSEEVVMNSSDPAHLGALDCFEARIGETESVTDGVIVGVDAKYTSTSGETSYDTSETAVYVGTDIVLTISSRNASSSSYSYQYRLISSSDSGEVYGEWKNIDGNVLKINSSSVEGNLFDGRVEFRAYNTDGALCVDGLGTEVFGDEKVSHTPESSDEYEEDKIYIRWSTATPTFGVSPTYVDPVDGATKTYVQAYNVYAPSAVTYFLSLGEPLFSQDVYFYWYTANIDGIGADVSYPGGEGGLIGRYSSSEQAYYVGVNKAYYYADGKWFDGNTREPVNNPGVSMSVESSKKTLKFFATTEGGNNYAYPTVFSTNIDKVKPEVSVTMRDSRGSEFYPENSGAIFALNSLTFNITTKNVLESAAYTEYQYRVSADDEWVKIDPVTSSGLTYYTVTKYASGENEFYDGRYFFRVKSAAGLYSDEVEIVFSVDSSDFYFSMSSDNGNIGYDMSADWAYQLPVTNAEGNVVRSYKAEDGLRIEVDVKVLGIYTFYYTVKDRDGETQMLVDESIDCQQLSNGCYRYTCILKESVKDGVFTFYAKNRAGYVSAKVALNEPISIDSYPASVKTEGYLSGNLISSYTEGSVTVGEYINGKADIIISPVSSVGFRKNNVSGYEIFRVVGDNEIALTSKEDGTYVLKECSSGGDYTFLIRTGAGVESTLTYRLNVESADISITDVEILVSDEDGKYSGKTLDIDGLRAIDVATCLKLTFKKNSDYVAPFNILYRTAESSFIPLIESSSDGVVELDLSKLKDDGSFSDEEGYSYKNKGSFTFFFKLESVAVDASGQRKSSDEREITINVNREVANLTVTRQNSSASWHKGEVKIMLANKKDHDGESFIYQIAYVVGNAAPDSWNDIDLSQCDRTPQHSGDNDYYVYTLTLDNNFNGIVYFRALNSAGYVGATESVRLSLMYDNTTPDVTRAILIGGEKGYSAYDIKNSSDDPTLGTVVKNGSVTEVYVASSVELCTPDEADGQFAPTLFFAYRGDVAPAVPEISVTDGELTVVNSNGWVNLAESSPSLNKNDKTSVYMYATNGSKDSGVVRVDIIQDNGIPELSLSYAASAGATDTSGGSGVFTFHWAEYNDVTLSATTSTAVRYQVNINDAWYDLGTVKNNSIEVKWLNSGESFDFSFGADSLYILTGARSIMSTVRFRAISKTGAYKESSPVNLRIDTEAPEFDLVITSGDETYTNVIPADKWFTGVVKFTIVPKNADANPGGVTYQYSFERDPDFTQGSGSGGSVNINNLTFTSNNLDGLISQRTSDGEYIKSGYGTLTVYAVSRVSDKKTVKQEVSLKIDALMPEFGIDSFYYDDKGTEVTFVSGSWVNADSVTVNVSGIGETSYGSAVYRNVVTPTVWYMYSESGEGTYSEYTGSLTVTEKTRIYFKSVSVAGQIVEKIFDVNIDRMAPEIKTRLTAGGKFYVDERISWLHDDDTIKVSTLNEMQFSNGDIVSIETINPYKYTTTNRVTDPNYGLCKLYLEDLAGNVATFEFYMLPVDITVDNIEYTEKDLLKLAELRAAIDTSATGFYSGETLIYTAPLTTERKSYFENLYNRLVKRLDVLQHEVDEFRSYLYSIAGKSANAFTLQGEYSDVASHIEAYNSYAQWEKDSITEGTFVKNSTTYKYNTVFNVLEDAYKTLKASMDLVDAATDAVSKLPAEMVVEESDYETIMRAYNVHASLTADQKSVFPSRLLQKLLAVKARCEELMLTTDTGVKVEGDKLPDGIRLVADEVNKSTDDYASVQSKILSATADGEPRSVVMVRKVYFTGEGSTKETGSMTMTLTIPDGVDELGVEYRNYTAFSVYRYLSDGSVLKMSDVTIAPDGKSVSFTTDEAGTYALVSNSTVREKADEDKVYGYIGDLAIDATMIIYIAVGAGVLFIILIVILIITGVRRRAFLARYDERYRYGLRAKGITRVPKGNKVRARNPRNRSEYARPMPAGLKEGKPFDPKAAKKERKKAEKAAKNKK